MQFPMLLLVSEASWQLLTSYDYIVPGLTAGFAALIAGLIITRDLKKVGILLFPLYLAMGTIGFHLNMIFAIMLGVAFVLECGAISIITNYLVRVRSNG